MLDRNSSSKSGSKNIKKSYAKRGHFVKCVWGKHRVTRSWRGCLAVGWGWWSQSLWSVAELWLQPFLSLLSESSFNCAYLTFGKPHIKVQFDSSFDRAYVSTPTRVNTGNKLIPKVCLGTVVIPLLQAASGLPCRLVCVFNSWVHAYGWN